MNIYKMSVAQQSQKMQILLLELYVTSEGITFFFFFYNKVENKFQHISHANSLSVLYVS